MNSQLPTLVQAKQQARRLRARRAEDGTPIGHARALECIAHQHGFRDWNTLFAVIANAPPKSCAVGDRLSGTYLSQPFTAQVIAVSMLKPGWVRLELHLDEPVDVVTWDGFSNFRRRIRGVIGPKGHSVERTSDGQPHLHIDPW